MIHADKASGKRPTIAGDKPTLLEEYHAITVIIIKEIAGTSLDKRVAFAEFLGGISEFIAYDQAE